LKMLLKPCLIFLIVIFIVSACSNMERAEPSIIPLPEGHFEGPLLSGNMTVQFIGLEAGEATLIRVENGPTVLIDTGHAESEQTLISFLRNEGITEIQYLILTHFGDDFIGNAEAVIDSISVENIVVPTLLKEYLISNSWNFNGKVKQVVPGDQIKLDNQVELLFLSPKKLYLTPQNNSLVFLLRHKDIQFLFTSAINAEVERDLTEKYNLQSEILKVSDFGSNQASYAPFIEEVDAQVAILFHPAMPVGTSDEVLERLHETWIDVYSIKKQDTVQTIKVISNGENYEIIEIEKDFAND
jgi:competence protein ComEC